MHIPPGCRATLLSCYVNVFSCSLSISFIFRQHLFSRENPKSRMWSDSRRWSPAQRSTSQPDCFLDSETDWVQSALRAHRLGRRRLLPSVRQPGMPRGEPRCMDLVRATSFHRANTSLPSSTSGSTLLQPAHFCSADAHRYARRVHRGERWCTDFPSVLIRGFSLAAANTAARTMRYSVTPSCARRKGSAAGRSPG